MTATSRLVTGGGGAFGAFRAGAGAFGLGCDAGVDGASGFACASGFGV